MTDQQDKGGGGGGRPWGKFAVLFGVVALAVLGFLQFRDVLTLDYLASREAELRGYQGERPVLVFAAGFLLYVLVTALSLPGALILTLASGWFFGFWKGLLLVSFASTLGATLAMLMSRYFLGDWVQARYGEKLAAFNRALEREGAFYLFSLRLIPVLPFFVINLLMGLTKIRTLTYWWVSQLGMLAGTAVYVYAGSQVPTLGEFAEKGVGGILSPGLLVAFVLLGVFPIVVKKLLGRFRPASASSS